MVQKFFRLSFLLLAVYLFGHIWFLSRDGFTIRRIAYHPPKTQQLDGTKEENILPLLNQPYYYLGKGRQCYAFISADDQIVVKIPRFDRYRLPLHLRALSFSFLAPYKELSLEDRTKRLRFLLESFRIAEEEFSEHTDVLYSHLHETQSLPKEFIIHDRLHRPHRIDLNQTVFAIQKKHDLLIPLFLKELKNGNRKEAEKMLSSLLAVIKHRAQIGLFNKDARFLKNYSWDQQKEKCIQIDIGSFYREEGLSLDDICPRSFFQGAWPIREWLISQDCDLASLIEDDFRTCWSPSD